MTHCRLASPPGLEVARTRQQQANDFWLCLRSGKLSTELLDLLREMLEASLVAIDRLLAQNMIRPLENGRDNSNDIQCVTVKNTVCIQKSS